MGVFCSAHLARSTGPDQSLQPRTIPLPTANRSVTPQMEEYAARTLQDNLPRLAKDYR